MRNFAGVRPVPLYISTSDRLYSYSILVLRPVPFIGEYFELVFFVIPLLVSNVILVLRHGNLFLILARDCQPSLLRKRRGSSPTMTKDIKNRR